MNLETVDGPKVNADGTQQLAEYHTCCSPCCSGSTVVSLVGAQIRWSVETPDLLCCCITEKEEDHDIKHVYSVGRYTPSCWRKILFCCLPCCTNEGVTYEYGQGSWQFIRSTKSKEIMKMIQDRSEMNYVRYKGVVDKIDLPVKLEIDKFQ